MSIAATCSGSTSSTIRGRDSFGWLTQLPNPIPIPIPVYTAKWLADRDREQDRDGDRYVLAMHLALPLTARRSAAKEPVFFSRVTLDSAILMQRVMIFIPLVLSLTVHEYGHAWSAYRLGDDTAARAGRLSLNPLVHMDLLGTVILPLLGVPFGWAKPVPVNPVRFRRDISMTTGMMLTAAAGPIMNVLIAVASTVAYALAYRFKLVDRLAQSGIRDLLEITIALNVSLAIFNLIPVPPLDGSRIVDGLIPTRWRGPWEQVVRLSPFLLLAVIWFGSSLIAWPSEQAIGLLRYLFHALAT